MAAKKPGRAGSGKTEGTTDAPTSLPTDGVSDAVGGTGARSRAGAKKGTDSESKAGGAGRARKAAASKGGDSKGAADGASGGGAKRGGKAASGGGQNDLQKQLRGFVEYHPHGWSHGDWEGLLGHLQQQGIDTSDPAHIGSELEKERLVHMLEQRGISGLGASKLRGLADRFGNVHSLRQASAEDIASVSGINESQAQKIHESIR